MSEFKRYKRKGSIDARPYVPGEDLASVSISKEDREMGSPKQGDMIGRNRQNHRDLWLINEAMFENGYEEA